MASKSAQKRKKDSRKEGSGTASAAETSSPSDLGSKKRNKKTRWWLVLAVVAVTLVAVGILAPKVLRNYFVMQAERALVARDFQAAESQLDRAAELSPNDGEIAFLRARTFRKSGDFAAFEKSLSEARNLGYDRERCRRERWIAEAQSGKMTSAEKHFDELLDDQYGDSGEVAEALANGYFLTGRIEETQVVLKEWEKDYPDDPQPKLLRGLIQRQYGDREKAIEYFRESLELQPDFGTALMALAESLDEKREFEEAMELYRRCMKVPGFEQDAMSKLGRCLRRTSEVEEAYEVLVEAHKLDPDHVETLVELGRVEVYLQKFEPAIEHLEKALESREVGGDVYGIYATALRGVGRLEESVEQAAIAEEANRMLARVADLSRDLQGEPNDLEKRVLIGRIILRYGSEQEGLMWLFSTLDRDPEFKMAHAALAEYFAREVARDPSYVERAQQHRLLAGDVELKPLSETW